MYRRLLGVFYRESYLFVGSLLFGTCMQVCSHISITLLLPYH